MTLSVESRLELAGTPLAIDHALRTLEVLRQRLSVRWCGAPGSFAGYDALELSADPPPSAGEIVFTARLVDAGARTHRVQLTATETATDRVVLIGSGRTVATPSTNDPRCAGNGREAAMTTHETPTRTTIDARHRSHARAHAQ